MGLGGLSNDDFIPQKSVFACPFSQNSFFYIFATLALCIKICLFTLTYLINEQDIINEQGGIFAENC